MKWVVGDVTYEAVAKYINVLYANKTVQHVYQLNANKGAGHNQSEQENRHLSMRGSTRSSSIG